MTREKGPITFTRYTDYSLYKERKDSYRSGSSTSFANMVMTLQSSLPEDHWAKLCQIESS